MTPRHRHPFIDGLDTIPHNRKKDIHKIRSWLHTQPHLPQYLSDEYIYLFLHACYYSHEKCKIAMENYFTIRSNHPNIWDNRDAFSPRMQLLLSMGYLVRLPKATPEGYKVLLYSVRDPDPSKLIFNDAVKGFCMYNDCVLSEDGLAEGYVCIFDMKGVQIGHLARVSLPALRAFMFYIQEAHPARLKAVHILNTATWVHHIMRIVIPLVKSEMLGIVKFHKGNIPDGVPQEILPLDYGGEAPSIEELDQQTKSMVVKYGEWLKETVHFKADESKRIKKTTWWGLFNGSNSTDKIDEKTFLKNLQID